MQGSADPVTRLVTRPGWVRNPAWADDEVADWFADHARDLAYRFAAPLLEREAAGTAATSFRPDTLAADAEAAAVDVVERTLQAYAELAERCIRERRLGRRGRRVAAVDQGTVARLRRAAGDAVDGLAGAIVALNRAQDNERRTRAARHLEQAWAEAWDEIGRAVDRAWREELGPALVRLDRLGTRRGPWLAVALLVAAAGLVAAVVWTVL